MASEPLVRTSYTDPTLPSSPPRNGDTAREESMLDLEQHGLPLGRIHGSALHGWGIGEGLALNATSNQAGLRILPGVAVDANGRHIALAQSGKAEIGPNADNPAAAPQLTDVTAAGALLPTAVPDGQYFASISWRETFDQDAWQDKQLFQLRHTPWLRLEAAAGINDASDTGLRVLLGRVTIAGGQVTALSHERRRKTALPAHSLRLWRGQSTNGASNLAASDLHTAELRARASGGLELNVLGAADQIEFKRDGGNIAKVGFNADLIAARNAGGADAVLLDPTNASVSVGAAGTGLRARAGGGLEVRVAGAADQIDFKRDGGNLSKVGFNADLITGRSANGTESVVIDTGNANITLGALGNEGDVVVKDQHDRRVIILDGSTASVNVGAPSNEGDLRIFNAAGHVSLRMDGATGDHWFQGLLRDPAGRHGGISHEQLRDLCSGYYTNLHAHTNSGNAARGRVAWLWANQSGTVSTLTINFGSPRQMMAMVALAAIDPVDSYDRADLTAAEIYQIDGRDYRAAWRFNGDHYGPDGDDANLRMPVFSGVASSVTFRLRSFINVAAGALCCVFPEF